jgi:hypothetical protein
MVLEIPAKEAMILFFEFGSYTLQGLGLRGIKDSLKNKCAVLSISVSLDLLASD